MSVVTKSYQVFLLGLFFITISACSSTPKDEGYKGIYDAKTTSDYSLEVPPDLTSPSSSNALIIPNVANSGSSFSEYSNTRSTSSGGILPKSSSGVRFVRDGGLFWLEIESEPDEIWQQVRTFFMDLGFSFVTENPVNGLLETNWLENRFDVPTGWIASMLGGLFSSGTMDKYRIRIERTDKDNVSLLFITHQGLKEESAGGYYSENDLAIAWLPRESDPELEAEMLQRYLAYRGIRKAQAKRIVSKSKSIDRAKLIKGKDDNSYVIEVSEIFPRTWRRISIALDRMGLVVEDRNRSQGIYYIKTTEGFVKGDRHGDSGWFASLFSSSSEHMQIAQFQLKVDDLDSKTRITILNDAEEQDKSKTGLFILEKLKAQLN